MAVKSTNNDLIDTVELTLSRAAIGYDHIYKTETGYQIECYNRRAKKLVAQVSAVGFINVAGCDSRVWRPISDEWSWYATVTFELPVLLEKPPRRIWLDAAARTVTISHGKKSRCYPVDHYPVTRASAKRLQCALDGMDKTVEIDDDFSAFVYFYQKQA